jgi:hypothetical protein
VDGRLRGYAPIEQTETSRGLLSPGATTRSRIQMPDRPDPWVGRSGRTQLDGRRTRDRGVDQEQQQGEDARAEKASERRADEYAPRRGSEFESRSREKNAENPPFSPQQGRRKRMTANACANDYNPADGGRGARRRNALQMGWIANARN